jgi:hypothetical protein
MSGRYYQPFQAILTFHKTFSVLQLIEPPFMLFRVPTAPRAYVLTAALLCTLVRKQRQFT